MGLSVLVSGIAICALQLSKIQANEIPIVSIKDVHSTKSNHVTFLAQHRQSVVVHWTNEATSRIDNNTEFARQYSPGPVSSFSVRTESPDSEAGLYIETERDYPGFSGSVSVIAASPRKANLKRGHEFAMTFIVERVNASRTNLAQGIRIGGFRNGREFLYIEDPSDASGRRFDSGLRCSISNQEKPENTIRVKITCYISGVPVGTTDTYSLMMWLHGALGDVRTDIKGRF
ncbi:hypothetical protein CAPTEDRAFT_211848 [Capitella teleta]|uniref:Uncharacterized protein n=1 Tax=Capitella teleta TaxID=283909 RepID=R7UDQ6_CAPTE|nr:hypothetical protein CAPTEDRAFT_211848 [Capitella teleta]|eukprot:ELU01392.1 hypothetical protein CAPTEDRAFT_211848 [Capitella teleta]